MSSNNPPEISLNLTSTEAKFLLQNCNANIRMGLGAIEQKMSESSIRKLIELMEDFKTIREKLLKAGVQVDD